jgi:hypothetical protein
MGWHVFEVGLFKPDATDGEAIMLPRTWDADTLVRSVPWLRYQNRDGRNIYIRPHGEHNLSLVDDLNGDAILAMKRQGFSPALVVQTSPGNYQAWLKHPEQLNRELGTAAARALAERFGGDRGAADWRHFGRLAGLTNRKAKYHDAATGLYPFVLLIEADGKAYPEAERFLAGVAKDLDRQRGERERVRHHAVTAATESSHPRAALKTIDAFRADPRYAGDGTRIDLAFAIYALSHGSGAEEIAAAIRSRELSHKGNERRQNDYIKRTIDKAMAVIERQVAGLGR